MMKKIVGYKIWTNPFHFLAFGFGSGLMPVMPGTAGTVVAIPIYLMMQPLSLSSYLTVLTFMTLIGFWVCGKTSRDIGLHDYPGIVWDEIVGYLFTMIAAPSGWLWIFLGFAFFRLFDIWKPWPISWVNKHVKGGTGVVLDDILAAVPAWICLQIASQI